MLEEEYKKLLVSALDDKLKQAMWVAGKTLVSCQANPNAYPVAIPRHTVSLEQFSQCVLRIESCLLDTSLYNLHGW